MTSIPAPPSDAISETIEEGPARYVPFLARFRTALIAGSRFTAYTSEAGEALRPIVSPLLVKGAYAISWSYIVGDVAYAGYRANQQSEGLLKSDATKEQKDYDNLTPAQKVELKRRELQEGKALKKVENELMNLADDDKKSNIIDPRIHGRFTHVGFVMARRAVFQSIASMALPAFTVHSVVRYSAPLFKSSSPKVRRFGPTFLGLATIPALPYMFDEPVEHVIDFLFDKTEHFLFSAKEPSTTETAVEDASDKVGKTIRDAKEKVAEIPMPGEKKANSDSGLVSKALILGVGVDMLYLPRLRHLVTRHSRRILSQITKAGISNHQVLADESLKASSIALNRFAKRMLCEKELKEWRGKTRSSKEEQERLRWLAVRWTSKEALYKSLYPFHKLTWKDICISKINQDSKPSISFSEEWSQRNSEFQSKTENSMEAADVLYSEIKQPSPKPSQISGNDNGNGGVSSPNLHLSISHDGEYVVAYVIAETT